MYLRNLVFKKKLFQKLCQKKTRIKVNVTRKLITARENILFLHEIGRIPHGSGLIPDDNCCSRLNDYL